MKLICCHKCADVKALRIRESVTCHCGAVSGVYITNVQAEIRGQLGNFSVIGFANASFEAAILDQLHKGDLPKTLWYGNEFVSPGRRFEAFVIPDSAPSVTKLLKTNE